MPRRPNSSNACLNSLPSTADASAMALVDVSSAPCTAAKIFASGYALFSGLVFIVVMGIFFAPIMHRILHSFHMEDKDLKR